MQIGGQKDRLVSLVQQRYGHTRERAQQEVDQCHPRCGVKRGRDGRDGGRQSPRDGGSGRDGSHRHRGWGWYVCAGKRRAGTLRRPRGAHPPLPHPGAAHGAGAWLCPRTQFGDTADGSWRIARPCGARVPILLVSFRRQGPLREGHDAGADPDIRGPRQVGNHIDRCRVDDGDDPGELPEGNGRIEGGDMDGARPLTRRPRLAPELDASLCVRTP
jgi:hypothetical protein